MTCPNITVDRLLARKRAPTRTPREPLMTLKEAAEHLDQPHRVLASLIARNDDRPNPAGRGGKAQRLCYYPRFQLLRFLNSKLEVAGHGLSVPKG
jgi:hypothetical protein